MLQSDVFRRALPHMVGGVLALAMTIGAVHAAEPAASRWRTSEQDSIRTLAYAQRADLLGQSVDYTLRFTSDPTDEAQVRGVLAIELELHDIKALDFPFADFEGPDAPALESTPMTIAVVGADGGTRSWTLAPNGWTPDLGRYTFGIAAVNSEADSLPRQLYAAVARGAQQLDLRIVAPASPDRVLHLTVPLAGQATAFESLLTHVAGVRLRPDEPESP